MSPSNWVHTDGVIVFKFDGYDYFSILQSTIHGLWSERYSSSLDTRHRYIPTDCFERFPLPFPNSECMELGLKYDQQRQNIMNNRNIGLTKIYNLFSDPNERCVEIQLLRQLHIQIDNAVAAAYGWTDLDLGHGFYNSRQRVKYTIHERAWRQILARLLRLNHERYEEEIRQGLHGKHSGKAASAKRKMEPTATELKLF